MDCARKEPQHSLSIARSLLRRDLPLRKTSCHCQCDQCGHSDGQGCPRELCQPQQLFNAPNPRNLSQGSNSLRTGQVQRIWNIEKWGELSAPYARAICNLKKSSDKFCSTTRHIQPAGWARLAGLTWAAALTTHTIKLYHPQNQTI